MLRLVMLFVLLLSLLPAPAFAQVPSEPILRIEAGMHTAPIWCIDGG